MQAFDLLSLALLAVVLGLIPATIAALKGRSFVPWWLYGAALFAIATPHAILTHRNMAGVDGRKAAEGYGRCPACAEMVRKEAKRCRYCHEVLVENV
jgi:hypothetical protein